MEKEKIMEMWKPTYITIDEVCEITQLAKPTIYRLTREGSFPKNVHIPRTANHGPKSIKAWDKEKVINYTYNQTGRFSMGRTREEHVWYDEFTVSYVDQFIAWISASIKNLFKNKYVRTAIISGILAGLLYNVL